MLCSILWVCVRAEEGKKRFNVPLQPPSMNLDPDQFSLGEEDGDFLLVVPSTDYDGKLPFPLIAHSSLLFFFKVNYRPNAPFSLFHPFLLFFTSPCPLSHRHTSIPLSPYQPITHSPSLRPCVHPLIPIPHFAAPIPSGVLPSSLTIISG